MEYTKDKIMENKKDLNVKEENIELVESIIISKKRKRFNACKRRS
jgi:hypothetical protein